jgi:DNA-binding NarL/FixJ family response regulator
MIRIMIVDDQMLFAETLKMVIETRAKDIRVIALAHSGDDAVAKVSEFKPDLVLMDVRMPGTNGVLATRKIHDLYPEVRIVMLTTYDDDEYILEALRHGAVGYLLKSIPPANLIESIRSVRSGNVLISPEAARKLLDHVYQSRADDGAPTAAAAETGDPYDQFSRRERDILRLVAQGFDNRQIAERLHLADQTVKNHISVIYSKLGVHDRVKLAMLAQNMERRKSP